MEAIERLDTTFDRLKNDPTHPLFNAVDGVLMAKDFPVKRSLPQTADSDHPASSGAADANSRKSGFVCTHTGCSNRNNDSSALSRHKRTIHKGVTHPCMLCGEEFSTPSSRTRHHKRKHSK